MFHFSTYEDILILNMESQSKFRPDSKLKLMDQFRKFFRYYDYAYRAEQTYFHWTLRYIRFFGGKIHPRDLNAHHVERFLSDLVVKQKVSASTMPLFSYAKRC